MPRENTKRRSCATSMGADHSRSIRATLAIADVNACQHTCKQLVMTGTRFAHDLNCKGRSHELVSISHLGYSYSLDPLGYRASEDHAMVLGRALAAKHFGPPSGLPSLLWILDRDRPWARRAASTATGLHLVDRTCVWRFGSLCNTNRGEYHVMGLRALAGGVTQPSRFASNPATKWPFQVGRLRGPKQFQAARASLRAYVVAYPATTIARVPYPLRCYAFSKTSNTAEVPRFAGRRPRN
jgi:hypothetical protein